MHMQLPRESSGPVTDDDLSARLLVKYERHDTRSTLQF